jgi:hypothetical protein
MWHSCRPFTVEQFLADKSPRARELYDRFARVLASLGPVETHATRTRIAFMVRVRFAGVSHLSDRGMTVGFWLKRRVESPRLGRVERVGPRDYVYRVRVTDADQLDGELLDWLREAYRVGEQRHLVRED